MFKNCKAQRSPFIFSVFLISFCVSVGAAAVADEVVNQACHQVVLAETPLLCVLHGVGSFSAEDRAEAISSRLRALALEPTFDADKLTVVDQESSTEIMAGDHVIASVRGEDVDPTQHLSRTEFAEQAAVKMRSAIAQDRKNRSPQELMRGVADSLGVTFVFAIVLLLLSRLYRRLYDLIRQNQGHLIPSLKFQTYEVLTAKRLTEVAIWLAQVSRFFVTLIAVYIYIPLVLSFFAATSNLSPKLYGYIVEPLRSMGEVTIGYIPKLFFIGVLIFLTRYLLRVVKFFFNEIENGTLSINGFYKEWADPTYKLVRVFVVAFAMVIAFPYIPGSSSPAFRGISVFLGVLVSLGSSSAIGNIVAGIVLTYMRPYRVGDRVKIADTFGDVLEKSLLVTKILTIKNVDVTIPNSIILGNHISNFSTMAHERGLIVHTTVTIGYDAPWKQVHALLQLAASRTELVETMPAPFVLQTSLDDFYVSYQINAFTKSPNSTAVILSNLHLNIQDAFNTAGVEIMSPHYSSLRDGNEITVPANVRDKNYRAPKFGVDLHS